MFGLTKTFSSGFARLSSLTLCTADDKSFASVFVSTNLEN